MFCFVLFCSTVFLAGKLYFLRKAAHEIKQELAVRLEDDTNTLIDISSRDKCMRQLAVSINRELRALRTERHRFQQGDLELKEAVTNISHDLRTPLTAICGYLELLKKEEKSERAVQYLAIIEERTLALKELTEEFLRYSVTKSVLYEIPQETVVLNHVLEESIAAYYSVIAERGITPEISIPETKIVRSLSKTGLVRVFGNILSNAAKYSDGDLKITMSESGIITFSNHASALDELSAAQLFGRYFTVENTQISTGLGLSIAKLLTEQMGGQITAEYKGILSIRLSF